MDSDRPADDFRRTLLRRACCFIPARGWSIRLPARSLLAALGISVRLDAFPGDSNGDDRGGSCGFRPLSWCSAPVDFSELMDRSPHRPGFKVRDKPFDPTACRRADDRLPEVYQYAGRAAREADPK